MYQGNLLEPNGTDNSFNCEQLRLARLAAGMSLVEVGAAIGVTRQYAHRLENDSVPSPEQLAELAKLLKVSENFFLGVRKRPIEADQCHFRSLRSSTQTIKKMVMAQVEMFEGSFISLLKKEVDFPEIKITDIGDSDISSVSAIEILAEKFRRQLDLGLGPISNMVTLAESIGCLVLNLADADQRVDAFSIFNGRPLIVRNTAKQSPCRSRFDIAHEIGHLVMHQGIETGCRKTEDQANNFASALLMPRTSFSAEFPRMRGRNFNWEALENMKVRWGVSLKAIIYRANKLGLITAEKAKSGFTYLARSGQTKIENGDERLTPEQPKLIQRAIDILDGYTWAKLLNESGLSEDILISRYLLVLPVSNLRAI